MGSNRISFTLLPRDERDHVLRIAHRGASAYAPENSLTAFVKAAEMGADMVEVDIRLTADAVPIVAHDDSLSRVFGVNRSINELTLAELGAALPAHVEPIPTFEKVAAVCADLKLGLYLDVKQLSPAGMSAIIQLLEHYGLEPYSIFGSFLSDWVAEIKSHRFSLFTSVLFASTHINPVLLARALGCDYVHPCWEKAAPEPHTLLTPTWMEAVRSAGLGVICWHEERPSEIRALANLGVDGICSDRPDVLLENTW
jgi:glycerophosphoryl diester phosphodiesterase